MHIRYTPASSPSIGMAFCLLTGLANGFSTTPTASPTAEPTPMATPAATATPMATPAATPAATYWQPTPAPPTCATGVDNTPQCPAYDAIGDIHICPDAFPTWTASTEEGPTCTIAIIGAPPRRFTRLR